MVKLQPVLCLRANFASTGTRWSGPSKQDFIEGGGGANPGRERELGVPSRWGSCESVPSSMYPGRSGSIPSCTYPGWSESIPSCTYPGRSESIPSCTYPGQSESIPSCTYPGRSGSIPSCTYPGQSESIPSCTYPGRSGSIPSSTYPGRSDSIPSCTYPGRSESLPGRGSNSVLLPRTCAISTPSRPDTSIGACNDAEQDSIQLMTRQNLRDTSQIQLQMHTQAQRRTYEVPYRLVYKTHFFAPKVNIKREGASYT